MERLACISQVGPMQSQGSLIVEEEGRRGGCHDEVYKTSLLLLA